MQVVGYISPKICSIQVKRIYLKSSNVICNGSGTIIEGLKQPLYDVSTGYKSMELKE